MPTNADLSIIVRLLAEDQIGGCTDDPRDPLDPVYAAAFAAIEADPNYYLILIDLDGAIFGTMQPACSPACSICGSWRG